MGRAPSCDKNGLKKGPWTTEEDQKLVDYIQENGIGNWRTVPKNAGLQRCGKSCRLRWTNYLRPDIKRGKFSVEEEETIIQLHSILGNKWSAIAARLPGRTDNEIKNYWNTNIRKKLLRMGIDPITHTDILETVVMNSSLSCCTDSSFISRLLGVQTLINPNLIRLLLPNQSGYDQGFLTHDNQSSHQLLNHDMKQIRTVSGQLCTEMQTPPPLSSSSSVQDLSSSTTFHDDPHQLLQCGIGSQDYFCQATSNIDSDQWQHGNTWPMFSGDDYVPLTADYGCYGSDQYLVDPNLSNIIKWTQF